MCDEPVSSFVLYVTVFIATAYLLSSSILMLSSKLAGQLCSSHVTHVDCLS